MAEMLKEKPHFNFLSGNNLSAFTYDAVYIAYFLLLDECMLPDRVGKKWFSKLIRKFIGKY